MPSPDEFFDRSEFVQYFRDETDELLQSIDADLLRLEHFVDGGTTDVEIVNSLFRALHTVKGSAGMLEFAAVQQVVRLVTEVLDELRPIEKVLRAHGSPDGAAKRRHSTPKTESSGSSEPVSGIRMNWPETARSLSRNCDSMRKTS